MEYISVFIKIFRIQKNILTLQYNNMKIKNERVP